jgi:hypothetical protein
MSKNIDFIRIDSDVNFYNTSEQVRLKNTKWFIDDSKPSELSGSYKAVGFFSKTTSKKRVSKGPSYVTSSTVTDSSGTSRKILAGSNDYLSGSVNDAYKQGVEISQEKHWTAGLAKITAGTPGHIHYFGRYGISDARIIIEEDYFSDLEVFDPVNFVSSGGTYDSTARYPLFIKSDFNQPEKLMLDGTIEPFPIRSVVSNFTNNVPFEPRSFKGHFF